MPDLVIVQGDTTTTFATALAAFYEKIPVAHIEAGLRTNNIYSPFPEEVNRRLTSSIATYHFAPTVKAKENLLTEGVNESQIYVTGNTDLETYNRARRTRHYGYYEKPVSRNGLQKALKGAFELIRCCDESTNLQA